MKTHIHMCGGDILGGILTSGEAEETQCLADMSRIPGPRHGMLFSLSGWANRPTEFSVIAPPMRCEAGQAVSPSKKLLK